MAVRNVIQIGDELLRKKSKTVKDFDENLWELLDDMRETMFQREGMGLAAPQISVLKRIVVIECNGMFMELINPVIVSTSGSDIEEEGCLSCGSVKGKVDRPMFVTVKAQDRYGYSFAISGEKYLSRVLCHEIDHLDGVLFVDKMIKEEETV